MTLVECQECGYQWDSSAKIPRCTQDGCGSRNVEEIEEESEPDEQADHDPAEQAGKNDLARDDTPGTTTESDDEPDDGDDGDDSSGYTPMFETSKQRTDASPGLSGSASSSSDDDQAGGDGRDRDDEQDDEPDDAEPEIEIDADTLEPAIDATFTVLDGRMVTDWSLEEEETQKLAAGWAPVANKWAPQLLANHGVEAVAVLTTFAILGPRLSAEQQARQEQQEREEATDAEPGTITDEIDTLEEAADEISEEITTEEPADNQLPAALESA